MNVEQAANLLRDTCYQASFKAGWWTDQQGQHLSNNPLTFSNKLMLTVSELAEAMEGDRKGLMDSHITSRPATEVELADAVIRIFDLAGAYGLDIGGAIKEKCNTTFNAKITRKKRGMASAVRNINQGEH